MNEVRWERMFPDELEKAFAACPVVYFSYGLCEPHGPQNVLGLDALKAHSIACEAARKHGGIVIIAIGWIITGRVTITIIVFVALIGGTIAIVIDGVAANF